MIRSNGRRTEGKNGVNGTGRLASTRHGKGKQEREDKENMREDKERPECGARAPLMLMRVSLDVSAFLSADESCHVEQQE